MTVVRAIVKVNGEVVHDESVVQEYDIVSDVRKSLQVNGRAVEVVFEFDPPLRRADAADEARP